MNLLLNNLASRIIVRHGNRIQKIAAFMPFLYLSLMPNIAHAAKLSDWFVTWVEEFQAFWPVINVFCIILGVAFAAIGLVGALTAKKNNQPAAAWQVWFMIGGVLLTILFVFVAALGGSLTGDGGAVESSAGEWGF